MLDWKIQNFNLTPTTKLHKTTKKKKQKYKKNDKTIKIINYLNDGNLITKFS